MMFVLTCGLRKVRNTKLSALFSQSPPPHLLTDLTGPDPSPKCLLPVKILVSFYTEIHL